MTSQALKRIDAQLHVRRSMSLSSLVREAIEEMIVVGQLEAGERINESTLAQRLNVSRGPIREACRGMEEAGFLEVKPNQGTFVRHINIDEARQLYELRAALTGYAGRLLATRITDAQIEELNGLVKRMEKSARKRDVDGYYPANLEFHRKLLEWSDNPKLKAVYDNIVNQLHLFRRRGLVQEGSLTTSNSEHRAILKGLKAGDPDLTAKAMRGHVESAFERLRVAVDSPAEAGTSEKI